MNYVKDPARLASIMKSLATHEEEVRQYFLAGLKPYFAAAGHPSDRLVKLFALANAGRLGTGEANANLVQATATFREYLNQDIIGRLTSMRPMDAHDHLLGALCDIKGMDQKTANLFLKFVVISHDQLSSTGLDWHSWEPHLHVPLDLWVLRLIGTNYLNVCGSNFEADFQRKGDYPSPSGKTPRYGRLQDDIRSVAASAKLFPIVLDSLWFVGSHYCSYHPLLCDICWLGEYCARHQIVDWDQVPVTLKSDEREAHRQGVKAMRQIRRVWKSQNPGKTDADLLEFLGHPEGRRWLRERLKE